MDLKELMAYIAATVSIVSVVPYLIDVVHRRTKPNIVSWTTWAMLTSIAAVATLVSGEPRAALLLAGSTVCSMLVVLLGLRYGIAKLSGFDMFCWAAALLGIVLWQYFNSPTIAIGMSVAIDLLGALPTIRHAWLAPSEETWQTFAISALGPTFTLLSLESYNIHNMLYTGYLLLVNIAVVAVVILRRHQSGIALSRHLPHNATSE